MNSKKKISIFKSFILSFVCFLKGSHVVLNSVVEDRREHLDAVSTSYCGHIGLHRHTIFSGAKSQSRVLCVLGQLSPTVES